MQTTIVVKMIVFFISSPPLYFVADFRRFFCFPGGKQNRMSLRTQ
jgi:hypothetical protein